MAPGQSHSALNHRRIRFSTAPCLEEPAGAGAEVGGIYLEIRRAGQVCTKGFLQTREKNKGKKVFL